jgi:hypothetical protein
MYLFYVKLSDARRVFNILRWCISILAFLALVINPFLFWFLGQTILEGHLIDADQVPPLPPFLAWNIYIAIALAACGFLVIWFIWSSVPKKMFEQQLQKFRSRGENELIWSYDLWGRVFILFLSLIVGLAAIDVIYLALTISKIQEYFP